MNDIFQDYLDSLTRISKLGEIYVHRHVEYLASLGKFYEITELLHIMDLSLDEIETRVAALEATHMEDLL